MRYRPLLIATLLALSLSSALSACSSEGASPVDAVSPAPARGAADASTAAAQADPSDIMFAQMMIPHHQQAIEMAQMALDEPTSSARVKALATSIKGAQDPEIQMMNGWLEAWGELGSGASFRLTIPRRADDVLVDSPLPLDGSVVEVGEEVIA